MNNDEHQLGYEHHDSDDELVKEMSKGILITVFCIIISALMLWFIYENFLKEHIQIFLSE